MTFVIGLDWGGAAHAVCVLDRGSGAVIDRFEARHDASGLRDMKRRLARHRRKNPPRHHRDHAAAPHAPHPACMSAGRSSRATRSRGGLNPYRVKTPRGSGAPTPVPGWPGRMSRLRSGTGCGRASPAHPGLSPSAAKRPRHPRPGCRHRPRCRRACSRLAPLTARRHPALLPCAAARRDPRVRAPAASRCCRGPRDRARCPRHASFPPSRLLPREHTACCREAERRPRRDHPS